MGQPKRLETTDSPRTGVGTSLVGIGSQPRVWPDQGSPALCAATARVQRRSHTVRLSSHGGGRQATAVDPVLLHPRLPASQPAGAMAQSVLCHSLQGAW